jgi:hypothetical protein
MRLCIRCALCVLHRNTFLAACDVALCFFCCGCTGLALGYTARMVRACTAAVVSSVGVVGDIINWHSLHMDCTTWLPNMLTHRWQVSNKSMPVMLVRATSNTLQLLCGMSWVPCVPRAVQCRMLSPDYACAHSTRGTVLVCDVAACGSLLILHVCNMAACGLLL